MSGTPATPSYPMLGADGNRIIKTQAFTIPFPCSNKPAADPHYGIGENMSCFGNVGAGSILNIPGTRVLDFDLTIAKNFPLKNERRFLQFRAEIYNLFNHTMCNAWNIQPTRLAQLAGRKPGPDQRQPEPLHGHNEPAADVDVAAVPVLICSTPVSLSGSDKV